MKALTPFFSNMAAATLMQLGGAVPADLLDAYWEFDDFSSFDADDDYVVTQATAGTADVIDGKGGLLQLDSNSTTADQGIQFQHKTETFLPAAGKNILFECLVKVTDTIDKVQFFAGLSILDTSIFASGEVSASNYIGFVLDATEQGGSNAGKPSLELNSTAGSEEKQSAAATLAEDTYIRLGFYLEGITSVTPIINGVPGTRIDITNCPITEMAVSGVCQTEGTNDPIAVWDWYYCVQLR